MLECRNILVNKEFLEAKNTVLKKNPLVMTD